MYIHYKIIGFLLIALALLHIVFPKHFQWKENLQGLSLINRQIMLVHTFFIALTVGMMGLLCLVATHDLIESRLGKTISLGLGIFWGIRLLFQLFVYSPKLWLGKPFETSVHVVFILVWSYLTVVFFWAALVQH